MTRRAADFPNKPRTFWDLAAAESELSFLGMKVRVRPGLPEHAAYLESRLADGTVRRVKLDLGHAHPLTKEPHHGQD